MNEPYFISKSLESQELFEYAILQAINSLKMYWNKDKTYNPNSKKEFIYSFKKGRPLSSIINSIVDPIMKTCINLSHPNTIAHMHCHPTIASMVAELLIGATNQSLDSWDESPSATQIEQLITNYFCGLVGYNKNAKGIITSGGTLSNLSALIVARDHYLMKHFDRDVKKEGVPSPLQRKLKILASKQAHFTIQKSAALLGLGANAVELIDVNDDLTLDPLHLEQKLKSLYQKEKLPFLIVATACSTNAGNVPDLKKIVNISRKYGVWLHVDAAYGGALLFSSKYKHLLEGIKEADSITFDPHKLLFQSISCGLFLLKRGSHFNYFTHHSDYLNPEADKKQDVMNLVDYSLQTTKRFDALKLYMSLLHLGEEGFDKAITAIVDLAQQFANMLIKTKEFSFAASPQTNIILFRYNKATDEQNVLLQKELYDRGKIALSKTKIDGIVYLKATCMNPNTTIDDYKRIIAILQEDAARICK